MIRPNKLLKKYNLKTFFDCHWWLIFILLFVLVAPIVIYFFFFKSYIYDATVWAGFVGAIIAYIGTSILSIFVYYFTWKQNTIDYNNNLPTFEITQNLEYEDDYFCLKKYDKTIEFPITLYEQCSTSEDKNKYDYHHIIFKNLTTNGIKMIKPLYYLYIKNEGNQYTYKKSNRFIAFADNFKNIGCGDTVNICFGVNQEHIFKLDKKHKHQIFRFVFEIIDYDDKKYCIVIDCILGKTLGVGNKFVYDSKYLDASAIFPEKVTRYYSQFL